MLSKKLLSKFRSKKAFSLIELSVVILIVSILITGVLSVSTSAVNNAKIKTTNERLEVIYKALGNFLLRNGRLPCPAGIKRIRGSDNNYGNEESCATNTTTGVYQSTSVSFDRLYYGAVPVKALNISIEMAEDGFGSKFGYFVHRDYTIAGGYPSSFTVGSFSIPNPIYDSHNLQLFVQPSNSRIINNGIVAVVSYGANKRSAFNATSSSQNLISGDTEERHNDVDISNPGFQSTLFAESAASDVFDDIVMFKTRDNFIVDFDAMYLIPCDDASNMDADANATLPSDDAYYGQTIYDTDVCGADPAVRAAVKCMAYGQWSVVVACP